MIITNSTLHSNIARTIARTIATTGHGGRLALRGALVPVSSQGRYLATVTTDESNGAQKGREGSHFKDKPTPVSSVPSRHVKEEGDYLLFHPVYTPEEIAAVKIVNRQPQSIADRLALYGVKTIRWGFDLVSGYRHPPSTPAAPGTSLAELREKHYTLSPSEWLTRIIFLESVAGVPGMVAGVLRHLRSLRGLRRDGGWIHSLLEEAENERMHLLTFLTVRNPGWLFRAAVLGAQGIFFNAFFLAYLVNPRICHRFVGYLEEEAVYTYTRAVKELENGHLPEWENYDAPQIAKDYWRLNQDAKLLDVLYAVRADESNHRFVNHTLASLNQKQDFNPFATHEPDAIMKGTRYGLEREEAFKWSEQTEPHK